MIRGKFVNLEDVKLNEAGYILKLRQDPQKTKYLPRLDISIEEQKVWMKERQKRKGDYYFLIKNKKGRKLGTIGIYNINGKVGEIGRWISEGNEIENTEAYILCLEWAFKEKCLEKIKSRPMWENKKIIRLSERMGFKFKEREEDPLGFTLVVGWLSRKEYLNNFGPKIRKIFEIIKKKTQ